MKQNAPTTTGAFEAFSNRKPVQKIENDTHVIHLEPRISASKLAEYIVADPTRQKAIAKASKKARKVILSHYSQLRSALPHALTPDGWNVQVLHDRASEIEREPAAEDWRIIQNANNVEAMRLVAQAVRNLDCSGATIIPRPKFGWSPMNISGVRVSVQPEVVFTTSHRGVTKVGAFILSTTQEKKASLARKGPDYTVGEYLSSLVFMMLQTNFGKLGTPLHSKCYAIDAWRSEVYTAPTATKTVKKQFEAACEMIALRWDTIDVGLNPFPEEEEAEF